jgi:hypothetical protein
MFVSQRRLEANRRNAGLSTGPKTEQGKLVSRNNALRHGLARPVASDPAAAKGIEALTRILAGARNDYWYRELARELADPPLTFQRIRNVCAHLLHQLGTSDPSWHEEAATQIDRIWRYQQRALARYHKALRAFHETNSLL